jgi:aminoglycoside 3-N-acetyltransferase
MNDVTPQIPRPLKLAIKSRWIAVRNRFVQTFLSYGSQRLLAALRELGVQPGGSVMLHSASGPQYGFKGSIETLTQVFIDAVGPQGHLLMVSLPYRSSSQQYLEQLKQFDVRHAPSMMGLVSEYFRRRPEVLRSLHPTHPMLVRGPQAHWYIEGHEACLWPCGPGTPFEKFAQRDGIVVLNAPFSTFTFFHHLEHLVHHDLPFALPDVAREVQWSTATASAEPAHVRVHQRGVGRRLSRARGGADSRPSPAAASAAANCSPCECAR